MGPATSPTSPTSAGAPASRDRGRRLAATGPAARAGYDGGKPDHVMCHHTASRPASDGWPDVNYCTFDDDDAPLCNLYLSRDGTVYVCAAGGDEHQRQGRLLSTCAPDTMNSLGDRDRGRQQRHRRTVARGP